MEMTANGLHPRSDLLAERSVAEIVQIVQSFRSPKWGEPKSVGSLSKPVWDRHSCALAVHVERTLRMNDLKVEGLRLS